MNITQRVQAILLRPRQEWPVIDGEVTSAGALYRGYVLALAAIGPVATLIGTAIFGVSMPFVGTVRVPLGAAITQAIVAYVLTLVGTYVFALVIDALAPSFSGTKSMPQALKVAVYSSTAAWLAGIFAIIPVLGFLGLLGLYSLYLLYLGLPVLMKAPQDKALVYTAVTIIVAIVVYLVIALIGAALASVGLG